MKHVFMIAVFLVSVGMLWGQELQYFPKLTFDDDQRLNNQKEEWYSKCLKALHESSISSPGTDHSEVYRFLWIRSFHSPVVVRLNVNKEGTSLLTVRVAKGQSWCESDKLAKDTVKTIPKKKTEWFLQRVQKLDYWRLPSRPPRTGGIGVDGAQWVIEASKDGAYKIVDRWSPDKGPVRALGLIMLFDMAKLRLQDRDVY